MIEDMLRELAINFKEDLTREPAMESTDPHHVMATFYKSMARTLARYMDILNKKTNPNDS